MMWLALAACAVAIAAGVREEAYVRHLNKVREENIEAQRQNGGRLE